MPKPSEHVIRSLTDFSQRIEEHLEISRVAHTGAVGAPDKINNWYRGVGMASTYKLVPSLYRHPTRKNANELLSLERRMLDWFKRRSFLYKSIATQTTEPTVAFEHLFFMQHYSVPTRLLDWTENPFIALYFALTTAPFNPKTASYDEDAAVWLLNPIAWNERSLRTAGPSGWGARGVLSLDDQHIKPYAPKKSDDETELRAMRDEAVALYGISNSPRMEAQRGVFIIFGRATSPMEEMYDTMGYPNNSLVKLIVPKDEIANLLDIILSVGFSDSVSFPDVHGLSLEIRRTFQFI